MNRRAVRFQSRHEDEEEHVEGVTDNTKMIPFESDHSLGPSKALDLFKVTFGDILESPDLYEHIQTVKGCLYNREYLAAFDSDDKRFAYASRWSPARALAYTSLFASFPAIRELFKDSEQQVNALCIGGGAGSEVAALGSVYCRLKEYNSTSSSGMNIDVVDIADWSKVIGGVTNYIKENWIYQASKFNTNFIHDDILTISKEQSQFSKHDLITLLFTTNELFNAKRPETVKFLHTMNATCKQGTYLLIAESAGSFSNITIGKKQFPVQFLVDMILVGKPGDDSVGAWEIVEQSESCWYRIEERQVEYPMKLENMRFFYRLYRKN